MFTEAPRWFGCPTQQYVTRREGVVSLIKQVSGSAPCYVSEYVFPTETTLRFDRVFMDFDSKDSLKGPYYDCCKMKKFCESLGLPYVIVFSGGKGFHFHFFIKTTNVSLSELWSLHTALAEELRLLTPDHHCFGNLRQIVRVPTSLYINKNGERNGRYCYYLTPRQFDKGIQHAVKLSKEPGILPEKEKSSVSFDEVTEKLSSYKALLFGTSNHQLNVGISRTREKISSVNVVAPACLRIGIQEWNPTHDTRFETTCWLKFIGFTDAAITNFYSTLKWRDFEENCTRYQIRRIRSRFPLCYKLKDLTKGKYCTICPIMRGE